MAHARTKQDRGLRFSVEPLEGRAMLSGAAGDLARASESEVQVERQAPRYGVSLVNSDVVYSRSGAKLDVYRPKGSAPEGGFPAIIALPGGGWRKADRRDYGGAVVSAFAPHGYVVVPTDYAYAGDDGGSSWPRNVQDVRDAVRYVRRNAARLGVNPNKIVVSGESAGAHLAALAGTLDDGPFQPDTRKAKQVDGNQVSGKPDAVVSFYGPMDMVHEWQTRGEARPYLVTFLGGSLGREPGRYEAASPQYHVTPDDAPTYLVQGTADNIIPVSQTIAFDRALQENGVRESLTLLPGIPHGFRFYLKHLNLAVDVQRFLDTVWAENEKKGT